jgi:hypothetical protein
MSRARFVVPILFLLTLAAVCSAQSEQSIATCNLEGDHEVSIHFNAVSTKNDKPPNGKPWAPGGAPMLLFTDTQLTLGGSTIPIGAYTVYPIPAKDKWSLVVNKNVTAGTPYDERQDIAHATMETDQVPDPASVLEVAFAHVGSRCTLRIYFGKAASFADFMAK